MVVFVGVKVAVITEVPTPATVRVEPETLTTEGVADEYVNVPATEFASVGAVTVKAESPKFLETLLQALKVGVSLGAEGRSELTDTDPVVTGGAPVPVLEIPSAVGFKKITESTGITLVLGYGKLAEKSSEYRALLVRATSAKQPVKPAGHVPVSGDPTLKFAEV